MKVIGRELEKQDIILFSYIFLFREKTVRLSRYPFEKELCYLNNTQLIRLRGFRVKLPFNQGVIFCFGYIFFLGCFYN